MLEDALNFYVSINIITFKILNETGEFAAYVLNYLVLWEELSRYQIWYELSQSVRYTTIAMC